MTDEERLKSSPVITFCPSYFGMRDFAKVVNDNKNMEITEKYNLEYYHSNIGTVASPHTSPFNNTEDILANT